MPESKPETPVRKAEFRFYEELNDFLPPHRRKRSFTHRFSGTPSVKDTIEALGVPHTEVDLILVDGESVGFDRLITGGERVAVYPMFERFDISPVLRLRPQPLRNPRFVLDVHLGKLARYLRLLGFDTLYRNDYDDPAIVAIAARERRIVLTRDLGVLKHNAVTHGYWLRETEPKKQLREVVRVLALGRHFKPFTRCIACNGGLRPVDKNDIAHRLPPRTQEYFNEFYQCRDCEKVYWPGSHYQRMRDLVDELDNSLSAGDPIS